MGWESPGQNSCGMRGVEEERGRKLIGSLWGRMKRTGLGVVARDGRAREVIRSKASVGGMRR